ncbi:MAG: exodeoxyribonuclease VII small subunit [Planctomycetes bacterium]|nr:exodeoxyribonuclease VII small subunit [Planctomycetota bacterium]
MSDKKKKGDEPSYAAASAELEQILQDIESGEIDLDLLSDKVERAATLLAVCRQKLAATETKVKKVTAELAAAMDQEATPDEDDA